MKVQTKGLIRKQENPPEKGICREVGDNLGRKIDTGETQKFCCLESGKENI